MPDDLTPRERTILDLNVHGITQKQIARDVGCGVRQVNRILERLRAAGYPVSSRNIVRSRKPHQVAELLNAGKTCREIAAELGLGLGTVRDLRQKAKVLGLPIPPPAAGERPASSFETMTRALKSIWAPAIEFDGDVFEDVRFKNDLD